MQMYNALNIMLQCKKRNIFPKPW